MTGQIVISLPYIISRFRRGIAMTWVVVFLENITLALVPLLIGLSIDGLLNGRTDELFLLAGVLLLFGVLAVGRRIYDTRVYGSIRLHIGDVLERQSRGLPVSTRAARLQMSRELVDFLETTAPELITACIQIVVSFLLLMWFDIVLALVAAGALAGMLLFYALFHRGFFRLNAALNTETEQRVEILDNGPRLSVFRHLRAIRRIEVALSDREAALYGGIFLLQIGVITLNLWFGAGLADVTAGTIFSIATYSWEFVEAALMLPLALQGWSRLSEISERLGRR